MKQYITKHGQNIYDISLVLYGSIEGIFDLLVHNDSINLNNAIPTGTVLEYDETFIVKPVAGGQQYKCGKQGHWD